MILGGSKKVFISVSLQVGSQSFLETLKNPLHEPVPAVLHGGADLVSPAALEQRARARFNVELHQSANNRSGWRSRRGEKRREHSGTSSRRFVGDKSWGGCTAPL